MLKKQCVYVHDLIDVQSPFASVPHVSPSVIAEGGLPHSSLKI